MWKEWQRKSNESNQTPIDESTTKKICWIFDMSQFDWNWRCSNQVVHFDTLSWMSLTLLHEQKWILFRTSMKMMIWMWVVRTGAPPGEVNLHYSWWILILCLSINKVFFILQKIGWAAFLKQAFPVAINLSHNFHVVRCLFRSKFISDETRKKKLLSSERGWKHKVCLNWISFKGRR